MVYEITWNGYKYSTIGILCLSFAFTFYLLKKCFKNFSFQTISYQRKLRIGSCLSILLMEILYSIFDFVGTFRKRNTLLNVCDEIGKVEAFASAGFAITMELSILLPSIATIDRYKRINMITLTHPAFKKFQFLQISLATYCAVSSIFGLLGFISFFFSPPAQIWITLGYMFMGSYTFIMLACDLVFNVKMIQQTLANQKEKIICHDPITVIGRLLNRVGYKFELYRYFILLALFAFGEVATSILLHALLSQDLSIDEQMDVIGLTNTFLMCLGIPLYNTFVYKFLDLLLMALKPTTMRKERDMRDFAQSGDNEISFFRSTKMESRVSDFEDDLCSATND